MKRYIPYEKLSKKEQRKIDLSRRGSWGNINPVTRKPENSKAYNRKKTQNWKRELPHSGSLFLWSFNAGFFSGMPFSELHRASME